MGTGVNRVPSGGIRLEPIEAYRCWWVDGYDRLKSVTAPITWVPGRVMRGDPSDGFGDLPLGVYAYRSCLHAIDLATTMTNHLSRLGEFSAVAVGRIRLWGDVVEHENGYRASHARIIELIDVFDKPLLTIAERAIEVRLSRLKTLHELYLGGRPPDGVTWVVGPDDRPLGMARLSLRPGTPSVEIPVSSPAIPLYQLAALRELVPRNRVCARSYRLRWQTEAGRPTARLLVERDDPYLNHLPGWLPIDVDYFERTRDVNKAQRAADRSATPGYADRGPAPRPHEPSR